VEPVNVIVARRFDQRRASLRTESCDQIDDPRRNPGFDQQFDEGDSEGRGVFRRFQHHGVACEQRGKHLPAWDRDRKVPRGDESDNPNRHSLCGAVHIGALGGNDAAVGHAAKRCDIVGHVDGFLDIAARLDQHFAHLRDHQAREPLLLTLQQLPHAKQRRAADRRGSPTPSGICGGGGGDRCLDIHGLRPREEPEHLIDSRWIA